MLSVEWQGSFDHGLPKKHVPFTCGSQRFGDPKKAPHGKSCMQCARAVCVYIYININFIICMYTRYVFNTCAEPPYDLPFCVWPLPVERNCLVNLCVEVWVCFRREAEDFRPGPGDYAAVKQTLAGSLGRASNKTMGVPPARGPIWGMWGKRAGRS